MVRAKSVSKTASLNGRTAATRAEANRNGKKSATNNDGVFLNVAVSKQTRAGLNKLVSVMNATNQRDVIENLIAAELHRHNMRLPRIG
jgi:hypothetical protein